jgi:PAS domain S-box-containing protein
MNDHKKNKEQLIKELAELRLEIQSTKIKAAEAEKIEAVINERKKVEEVLLETENRYHEIMGRARDVIFSLSPQGKLVSLNQAFEDITGLHIQDWIGKPFTDLLHPEDIPLAMERFLKVLNGHTSQAIELRIRNKSGDYIFGEFLDFPQIKNGKTVGLLGIGRDITERKKIEEKLRESEERFKTLSYIGSEGLMVHEEGIILDANQAFASLAGYTNPDDLIGKNGFEVIRFTPESKQIVLDHIRNNSNDTYDIEIVNLNGHVIPVETRGTEVVYKGRKVRLVYMRDITDRKKVEEALIESKALLTSIIDSTNDLIWSVDSERFSLLTFNKGLEDFFKREGIHIKKGQLLEDFLPEELVNKLSHLYSQTLKEGSLVTMYQTSIGNLTLWINLHILSRGNKTYAISAFAKDITEIMKAEEDLILAREKAEESDRLKTAFMNNISHEVRTPLNGILGFGQLILQTDIQEAEKSLYLEVLNTSSERLLNTITNYMDISLIVSGNMAVHKQPIDLLQLLDEIYKKFYTKCRAKNLEFIKQIPSNINDYSLQCDSSLLEKSISQLLDNAIKFTATGSVILGFHLKNNEYELFVKDSGSGIDLEAQDKVFDFFMQEEVSNTRGYEGSGLGLSITKGLVELMGGKIRMESVKGEGSTFFIALPAEPAIINNIESQNIKKPTSGTKISPVILIAEDDKSSFLFYKTIMERASYKYLRANNGLKAIEMCHLHPEISIVLMDIKMPEMNGLEATRKIRKFRKNLPIIGVTAYALIGDKENALEAGCDEYITKPVKPDVLLSVINKQLGIL